MDRKTQMVVLLSVVLMLLVAQYGIAKEFTKYVDSTVCGWQSTGIQVHEGDYVTFLGSGEVVYWKNQDGTQVQYANPNGTPGSCDHREPPHGPCCLAPGIGNNALIGKIGSGAPFYIGRSRSITASSSGELFLAMNETSYCGGCADNQGKWRITISLFPEGPKVGEGKTLEELDVQFTKYGGVTTERAYSGVVEFTISGYGDPNPGDDWMEDAFYAFFTDGHYAPAAWGLTISQTGCACLNECGAERLSNMLLSLPAYSAEHTYHVAIYVGDTPKKLTFGNGDCGVADNEGAYHIVIIGTRGGV